MTNYDNWKLGVDDPHFDDTLDFDPLEHGWKEDGVNKDGEQLYKKFPERKLTAEKAEKYEDYLFELNNR